MSSPFPESPRQAASKSKGDLARMSQIFGRLETDTAEQQKVVTNDLGMRFVLIPPGTFQMGSMPNEPGHRANEGPQRLVVVTKAFYMGAGPVTQAEYQRVMGVNPSHFTPAAGGGPTHPVETVSWDDAVLFCRKLSALPAEVEAGRTYRLPTEAEWEYACRAGDLKAFGSAEELSLDAANFGGGYGPDGRPKPPALGRTSPVGAYPANYFGLSDAHGNVWEWCADWYGEDYYDRGEFRDPAGPPAGEFRAARGGSWRSHPVSCRAAYRNALAPHNRDPYTGFRVVLTQG